MPQSNKAIRNLSRIFHNDKTYFGIFGAHKKNMGPSLCSVAVVIVLLLLLLSSTVSAATAKCPYSMRANLSLENQFENDSFSRKL